MTKSGNQELEISDGDDNQMNALDEDEDDDEAQVMALGEEFLALHQRGESPSIEGFCTQHPRLADQIREVFPTLLMLEASKSGTSHSMPLTKIGTHELVREIGRGGMGVVYEAQHETLGRRVAVKVLPKSLALDRRTLTRFQREAKAIAKLHHSNIVPLYDVGSDDGHFFFSMQLISGCSLDRALRAAKLSARSNDRVVELTGSSSSANRSAIAKPLIELQSLSESAHARSDSTSHRRSVFTWVARVGSQIADAMHYAHQNGIVHRDVKPSNILIDDAGTAWLSDFGLAQSDDDNLTQTGDFVGTLRYMPPERFRGECDRRADIYGLGLTLYEMLAMQPAYSTSDRLSLVEQIAKSNRPRLRDLNPRIPRDLETIVLKACDSEVNLRYQNAATLADDLQRFLDDRPVKARRVSSLEHLLRWSRRNRALASAIAVASLSVILLTVVSVLNAARQSELRKAAEAATLQSEQRGMELQSKTRELISKSDELQRNLYYARINLASAAAEGASGADTIKARLQSTHPDAIGSELRNWEWYYLFSLVHQGKLLKKEGGWTWEVSYSPDGRKLAYSINGFGVVIIDAASGEVVRVMRTNGCHNAQWSPDGKKIAASDYVGNILIWDADTHEELQVLRADEHLGVNGLQWSHDSQRLVSNIPRRKRIVVWNATTGVAENTIELRQETTQISCSPADNHLAVRTNHGAGTIDTLIIDLGNGETLAKLQSTDEELSGGVCWSPDGTRVVTSGPIKVWDWQSQKVIIEGPEVERGAIAWRPGFQQIAFPSNDGIKVWDVERGHSIRDFYGQPSIESLCWSPSGDVLASSGLDHTVRIWPVGGHVPSR